MSGTAGSSGCRGGGRGTAGHAAPKLQPAQAAPGAPACPTHAVPVPPLSAMWQEFKRAEPSSLWKYLIKIPSLPLFLLPDRIWVWGRSHAGSPGQRAAGSPPRRTPAPGPRVALGSEPLRQLGAAREPGTFPGAEVAPGLCSSDVQPL